MSPVKALIAAVLVGGSLVPGPAAAYEDRLNRSLQTMLDAVVGPGHAVATTAVELDLDSVETVTRSYDSSAAPLSEKLSRTSYTGGDGTRYDSSSTVRTQALDQVWETRSKAPGEVTRVSVAVLVDRAVDVPTLRKLVSAAAGVDPARGDTVVISVKPATPVMTAAAPVPSPRPVVDFRVLVALAVAAVLLLVLLRSRRRRGRREELPPLVAVASVPTRRVQPALPQSSRVLQ